MGLENEPQLAESTNSTVHHCGGTTCSTSPTSPIPRPRSDGEHSRKAQRVVTNITADEGVVKGEDTFVGLFVDLAESSR